jgi:alpha-beta hydrolase superfamily lysophospholipase
MRLRRFLIGCFSLLFIALIIGVGVVAYIFLSFNQEYRSPQELADTGGAFAEVNGASIYYIAKGESSNPAIILIHGFGGSTFTWRGNIDALAGAGYYVVALDLPPFGLSDKSPEIGYSRSDFAAYVAGLMDYLEIESATFVGHRRGGSNLFCNKLS